MRLWVFLVAWWRRRRRPAVVPPAAPAAVINMPQAATPPPPTPGEVERAARHRDNPALAHDGLTLKFRGRRWRQVERDTSTGIMRFVIDEVVDGRVVESEVQVVADDLEFLDDHLVILRGR